MSGGIINKLKSIKSFNVIMNVIIFILILVMAVCLFFIISKLGQYKKAASVYTRLSDEYTTVNSQDDESDSADSGSSDKSKKMSTSDFPSKAPISVDFDSLKSVNSEVVGWLYCKGTAINYPVVHGSDDQYYLHRLINKSYNFSGTIFTDYKNSSDFTDDNTIFYGHNMKNGTMFGIIDNFRNPSNYKLHPYMFLLTPECNYRIDFVSGYITKENSDAYTIKFSDSDSMDEYISALYKNSTFDTCVKKSEIERLVTFSTCAYDYEEARYVLVGNLVKIK